MSIATACAFRTHGSSPAGAVVAAQSEAGMRRREDNVRHRWIGGAFAAAGAMAVVVGSFAAASAQGASGAARVRAVLNGYQENPSISTTGHGLFTARIDDRAQIMEYELSYSGLEGGMATAAHIHFGARAHIGGVSAFLCGGDGTPPCPATEGTVTGVIFPLNVLGPASQGIEPGSFDELVRAIRAGHTYVNVHTPRWPGGEIRGQIHNSSQRESDR
jgi:hypothetical protein